MAGRPFPCHGKKKNRGKPAHSTDNRTRNHAKRTHGKGRPAIAETIQRDRGGLFRYSGVACFFAFCFFDHACDIFLATCGCFFSANLSFQNVVELVARVLCMFRDGAGCVKCISKEQSVEFSLEGRGGLRWELRIAILIPPEKKKEKKKTITRKVFKKKKRSLSNRGSPEKRHGWNHFYYCGHGCRCWIWSFSFVPFLDTHNRRKQAFFSSLSREPFFQSTT